MPEFRSDISRADLEPRIRDYDSNLDTQARALFDKNNLPHYNQSALDQSARTGAINLSDLIKLRNLLAKRNNIRKTGELPPQIRNSLEHQLETAREVLGKENVYGPDQINHVFNVDLDPQDIPPIPYSTEDLEKAKEMNMILILRISHNKDGNPLTPQRMNEELQPRMNTEGRGKMLHDTNWYKDEPFFTSETPINPTPSRSPSLQEVEKAEWKLITRTILKDSTSKNYLEQTKLLRDELAKQGWLTDEERDEVTDEKLAKIEPLLNSDWKKAAQLLANLKLTQNHRRTFSQDLYDTLLVYLSEENTEDRPLPNIWDWTATLSSVGELVDVGSLDSGGAIVYGWGPGNRRVVLGVGPSP